VINTRVLDAAVLAEIQQQACEAYDANPGPPLSPETAGQVRRILPAHGTGREAA
jgi:hypothetical protein